MGKCFDKLKAWEPEPGELGACFSGHALKIRCRQLCLRPRGPLASEEERTFREAREE